MLVKDIEPERQSFNLDSSLCYGSPDTRNVVVRDSRVLSLIIDEPCLKASEYLYERLAKEESKGWNVYGKR